MSNLLMIAITSFSVVFRPVLHKKSITAVKSTYPEPVRSIAEKALYNVQSYLLARSLLW